MSSHIDYEINKELGECYLFMGDYSKAAEYYEKAAGCGFSNAAPYLGLATIAVQEGRLGAAKDYYAKAAAIEEDDKALAGMALVEMEQGAHAEAFELFSSALRYNPSNMIAINCLVQEGHYLGKLGEVVPHLEACLGTEDSEAVRFTLAGCLTALNRAEEAKEQLRILLGRNPNNIGAQELYARIAA